MSSLLSFSLACSSSLFSLTRPQWPFLLIAITWDHDRCLLKCEMRLALAWIVLMLPNYALLTRSYYYYYYFVSHFFNINILTATCVLLSGENTSRGSFFVEFANFTFDASPSSSVPARWLHSLECEDCRPQVTFPTSICRRRRRRHFSGFAECVGLSFVPL